MTAAHVSGARHTPPPDADVPADEPVAAEGWRAGKRQWLLRRIAALRMRAAGAALAAAAAALDHGVALLQRWRQRAGGAEYQDEDCENDLPQTRAPAARVWDEPDAEAPTAPPPRRRPLLVYASVMLAGGILGGATAYAMLAHLVQRQAMELRQEEAKISGYSKSLLELKGTLEEQRAQAAAAQTRLAAARGQSGKTPGKLQTRRDQANPGSDAPSAGDPSKPADDVHGSGVGRTGSGECVLDGGDVRAVLAGCIAEMNRK